MNKTDTNPLYRPQKEKSGASTFRKYLYQYNWGLSRVLSEHSSQSEYAIFVELHEDVVVSNSLDASKAMFSFNQVKTNKGKFTVNKLTKQKNGSSVLGKLLDNCVNKDYSSKITDINLIAVNGFGVKRKDPALVSESLCIMDIVQTDYDKIASSIKTEIGLDKLPSNLYFIIPELPEGSFEDNLVGQISTLVNELFPQSQFNPIDIYRTLVDELQRKGTNTFDYNNWDQAIDKKALTSVTVTSVINSFTSRKNEATVIAEFNEICSELNYGVMEKRNMRRAFDNYRNRTVGQKDSKTIKTSTELRRCIDSQIQTVNSDLKLLIDSVKVRVAPKIKAQFRNDTDFTGAIIYEYIVNDGK